MMLKTKAKLLQKTLVKDEYGGSIEVLNYIREVNGYLVPVTNEKAIEGSKININTTAQYICDERIVGMNLVVEIDGELYEISKKINVYSKGCTLELVHCG